MYIEDIKKTSGKVSEMWNKLDELIQIIEKIDDPCFNKYDLSLYLSNIGYSLGKIEDYVKGRI